ncbi:MAG: hypothetical protein LBU76_09060 [Azoarcus sp.]|jgi:KDO transferase-3|nr:hypothetical protein [Azoarcus sp.]
MLELLHRAEKFYIHERDIDIPLQKFETLKNFFSGSVFIMASGASVAEFSVSKYSSFPFIVMNGSILRFSGTEINPIFYLCSDPDFPEKHPDVAVLGCERSKNIAMDLRCFNKIYEYDKNALIGKSLYMLNRVNRYPDRYVKTRIYSDRRFAWSVQKDTDFVCDFSILNKIQNRIGFSKNMDRGYFCARTIVYPAVQLAYMMGFKRVYIVGMDLNKQVGRFYEKSGDVAQSYIDDDYVDYILPSFKFFSERILKHEDSFHVFNLSQNSRLPDSILPKISYIQLDELLFQ